MADLQRSLDNASDARDLAKDVLRKLPDYDGNEDESTARHDAPALPPMHFHLHSEHEADPEELPVVIKGWPRLTKLLVAACALLVSAVVTYLAGRLGAK